LIVAAIMLAAAAAMRYADSLGFLGSNGRERGWQLVTGLMLALVANFMPKMLSRTEQDADAARRQQRVLRASGWLFTLAGLGYAALAFAPKWISFPGALALVGGAMLITLVMWWRLSSATGARRIETE
jgi:Na+/proline symporter